MTATKKLAVDRAVRRLYPIGVFDRNPIFPFSGAVRRPRLTAVAISLLVIQLLLSISAGASETLDSTQYLQFVRLKRVMAQMELWGGEVPRSLLMLEKDLTKAWVNGDRQTAIDDLDQAKEYIDKYQGLVAYGPAAIDDVPDAPNLLALTIHDDRLEISTPQSIELTPGVVTLCRFLVTNTTSAEQTIDINSPDLFRVGRQITVPPSGEASCTWLVRTIEVFPFTALIMVTANGKKQEGSILIQPKPDPTKPLVGLAIHIPNYGRYERIRMGGKAKPSPEEVKRHPELIRPIRIDPVSSDMQEEVRIHYLSLRSGPCSIYRLPGDWDFLELDRDRYVWGYIDANIQDIRQLTGSIPVLYLGYQPWWVKETRNPNGTSGFKDVRNQDLINKYRQYIRQIGSHTGQDVHWFELWNEPIIYWFYDENTVPPGPQYVSEYGDMLRTIISVSAQELREAVPNCWVISPGFVDQDMFPSEWTMLKYLMDHRTLDQLDALCVHKYPFGVDVMPPPGKSSLSWVELDAITDETPLLRELQKRGKDNMPLWCTELGGMMTDRLSGLAYLRMGTILAHQGFDGLHFTSQPVTLNLLQEAITGAEPVEWGPCRKTNSNHSGVVMKTFTRGPEDIVVLWNNSDETQSVRFVPTESQNPRRLLMIQEISEPLGGPSQRSIAYNNDDLGRFFGRSITLGRLEWKAFLIVPEGGAGFHWLSKVEGVGVDPQLESIEQMWNEVKIYQREVFSGEAGSTRDQMAFKDAYKTFRKAWAGGQLRTAESALQDMVSIGRSLHR